MSSLATLHHLLAIDNCTSQVVFYTVLMRMTDHPTDRSDLNSTTPKASSRWKIRFGLVGIMSSLVLLACSLCLCLYPPPRLRAGVQGCSGHASLSH